MTACPNCRWKTTVPLVAQNARCRGCPRCGREVTSNEYPCKECGVDIGWDAPSGVCSEKCLRKLQGFPPRQD